MHNFCFILIVLPIATTIFVAYSVRPYSSRAALVAPVRLGILRAAVVIGAISVVSVEVLSSIKEIKKIPFILFWCVACLCFLIIAVMRCKREQAHTDGKREWHNIPATWVKSMAWYEKAIILFLLGLFTLELILALAASPNNYDSYYYHLSKIENWVSHRTVDLYPTVLLPQVILVPGAEYLLLHLRLLTGGDAAYNVVQWGAGIGCALAVSRIACQLGANRFGQLVAAFIVSSAPMVVLQSTSTQTDLTVAAWVVVTASFILDEVRQPAGVVCALFIGGAIGMVVMTKSTGILCLVPFLLIWLVVHLRRVADGFRANEIFSALIRVVVTGVLSVAVACALVGPFMVRMNATFGDPLGGQEHRSGLTLQRHDPQTIIVNALRMGTSTLFGPVPALNKAMSGAVVAIADLLGVDPNDPKSTLTHGKYPDHRWWPDEDHAPFPLQSTLIFIAVGLSLCIRKIPAVVRYYAGSVLLAIVLYPVVLKWQLWGNRLVVPVFVVCVPLVGWWVAKIGKKGIPYSFHKAAIACVLILCTFTAYHSVLLGWPRRLVGKHSVFVLDDWHERFVRQPEAASSYRYAADIAEVSGAYRIGVIIRGDSWDYPWWLLLPGRDLVALQSLVPGYPPADSSSVEAIVCSATSDECAAYTPRGWKHFSDGGPASVLIP